VKPSAEARISNAGRTRNTRARVLLAILLLADDSGLYCKAGRKAIARQAGVCADTAQRYINHLAYEKVLTERKDRAGGTCLVFMDHPDCWRMLRWLSRDPWTRGPAPGSLEQGGTAHNART
jgi:predicted transcriptional regulator